MSDQVGPNPVPLVAPGTSPPTNVVADPALGYLLQFFQTVANANCGAAWDAAGVSAGSVVQNAYAWDPERGPFNNDALPALYMWRGNANPPKWLAEDWLIFTTELQLRWVFPEFPEITIQASRDQFGNGLMTALAVILERMRDPSWIVPGDPDKLALTQGSSIAQWAGFFSLHFNGWKVGRILIDTQDGKRAYDCVEARLELVEYLTYDQARLQPWTGGLLATFQTADNPPLVTGQLLSTTPTNEQLVNTEFVTDSQDA